MEIFFEYSNSFDLCQLRPHMFFLLLETRSTNTAVARAGAAANNIPLYQHIANLAGNKNLVLPVPAFNVINGGSHAGNALPMQEFMILPIGAKSFSHAMQIGSECYHHLKKVIKKKFGQDSVNVGDEGGFAPPILENDQCWELIAEAVKAAGYEKEVRYGMDVAASEFFIENKWAKKRENITSNPVVCPISIKGG